MRTCLRVTRPEITWICVAFVGLARVVTGPVAFAAETPTSNPVASYGLDWTNEIAWDRVVDITTIGGKSWQASLAAAQRQLVEQGGGVVYFPAGEYYFPDSVTIQTGIVLRGADPKEKQAISDRYSPPTRFEFPQYKPKLSGDGTPISAAFKGIYLADPATASNCGVVHLAINRGHVHLRGAEGFKVGRNRLVAGCRITNAAVADPAVPDRSIGQKPWQRYPQWHHAAINVRAEENALVANNRLAPSSDNFTMKDYVMRTASVWRKKRGKDTVTYDVVFDYDNRPGITVNDASIGAPGGEEPSGTPQSHPWGFRKGAVIRDNYIYSTGRTAIAFTGDGTICSGNVIRFKKDVWRPTNTGRQETHGASTNDNRALQMRGYRWRVENNDYEVYRNWCSDRKYYINDGEGLMHENHCNSAIVDSVLRKNRGNTYLSLYKTGSIDGLLIEGNDIRVAERKDRQDPKINGAVAIFVESDHDIRKDNRGPCRNVSIINNTTVGGILIGGEPSSGNVIKGNRNIRGTARIYLQARGVKMEGNKGYEALKRP